MADISICVNKECPLRGGCYRAQASINKMWQSVSIFEFEAEGCKYHWPMHVFYHPRTNELRASSSELAWYDEEYLGEL